MTRTKVFAAKIGDGGFLAGISEIFGSEAFQDFITQILTMWMTGCALPVSGQEAKRMAEEEWDEDVGRYSRRFLRRATRTVRQQARKKRKSLTPDELERVAVATLDAVRLGDEEEMTIGIYEQQAWTR